MLGNIIASLYFQYSEMPCSNLFPGCLQGYYRSFWLSNRQEMWSSSFGLCVSQRTALADLCVTARGSVTAPIQLKITSVRLFFFLFQLLWTFLSEQKHSPLFRIYAYVVWRLLFSSWAACSTLSTSRQSSIGSKVYSVWRPAKFGHSVPWPLGGGKGEASFTEQKIWLW